MPDEKDLKINPETSFLSLRVVAGILTVVISGASWATYVALQLMGLRDGQTKTNDHLLAIEGKIDGDRERIGEHEYRLRALESKVGITSGR